MKPDGELPDDLHLLGVYLEDAARETLRRRQRRQTVMNFIGTVMLSLPFAIAVAAADLSPADSVLPSRPTPLSLDVQAPATVFRVVGHVPDQPLPSTTKDRCSDAQVCRAPAPPIRYPATPGQR
jgi:hypothetical protein